MNTAARSALVKQALRFSYVLVGWNVVEGLVALGAGIAAGSIALVGFGFDSVIEVISNSILIWRLRQHGVEAEEAEEAEGRAERRALLVVGITFFLLMAFILFEAAWVLLGRGEPPERSLVGIVLAALSLIVMPYIGLAQRRRGKKLGSKALQADALETIVCAYLSLILLVGLGLNALWGWWWADPIAALAMLPLLLKEGREAVKEGLE